MYGKCAGFFLSSNSEPQASCHGARRCRLEASDEDKGGKADRRSKTSRLFPVSALDYDYMEVHEWLSPQFQLLVYGSIGTATNVAVIASLTSENNIALE